MNDSGPPKPKRRWFQNRLRTLLALALLTSAGLGLWSNYVRSFRSQAEAAEQLREVGAAIETRAGAPAWMCWLFGGDRFQNVVMVHLEHQKFKAQDLAPLRHLPHLEQLYLAASSVDDVGLAHVRGLRKIKRMSLWKTNVTDDGMANLAGLTSVEVLDIHYTKLSDECLVHLEGMSRLERLILNFALTDKGLQRLAALPNIRIQHALRCIDVTGEGIRLLAHFPDVGDLSIDSSLLTDADLEPLTRLPKLRELKLATSSVTDAGLKTLADTSCARLSIRESDVSFRGVVEAYGKRTHFIYLYPQAVTVSSKSFLHSTIIGGTDRCGPLPTSVAVTTPVRDDELVLLEQFPDLIGVSLARSASPQMARTKAVLRHLQQQQLDELTCADLVDAEAISALGKLTGLRRLAIGSRLPDDATVLQPLGNLRHMEHLSLRGTGIGDQHLRFLENLTELRTLDLGENPIAGAGLRHIAGLSKLENLWLIDSGKFTDSGMVHLESLKNLTFLCIQYTQVTDVGLKHIHGLPRLRNVTMVGSRVTRRGRQELSRSLGLNRVLY